MAVPTEALFRNNRKIKKNGFFPLSRSGSQRISAGDGAGGALVDASCAVNAFSSVDDCDVVAGDSSLGADVDASAARNTLRLVDFGCHDSNLRCATLS